MPKTTYCNECEQEIEFKSFRKRDGTEGYRPVDPGKDSHPCPKNPKYAPKPEGRKPVRFKTDEEAIEVQKALIALGFLAELGHIQQINLEIYPIVKVLGRHG